MEWVSLFQGRDFIVMPFPDFNACRRFLHSWVFKQHSVPGGALKERKKCRNPLASIKAFYNIATPEWMAFWPEKGYGEKAQHKALGGNTGTRHKNMMITHKKGDYHECSLVAACCPSEKYHPQQKNWYPNLLTHISTPSPLIAALGYLSFCMHFLSPLLTGFFFFFFFPFAATAVESSKLNSLCLSFCTFVIPIRLLLPGQESECAASHPSETWTRTPSCTQQQCQVTFSDDMRACI